MQKNQFPSKDNKILNKKYEIIRKLKTGGFGSVYYARGLEQEPYKYAVKLMPKKYERYAAIENKIYRLIKEKKFTLGFIKHFENGSIDDHLYLVMELIGYDLDEVMHKMKDKKFTLKTVLMIGLQTIDRIQALHSIGYIHRDIKPDNLAIGNKQKNNIIYLFDFGLVIKATDPIPSDEKGKMVGTLGFMSLRMHQSKKATYWDDIQCFIYTLVYLLEGSLPWMQIHVKSATDYHRIKIMKQKLDKEWFKRHNIPVQLSQILQLCRGSSSQDKIDYLAIKYKLLAALNSINKKNDFMFDWTNIIKITHDSPVKRVEEREKINKMHQSNQKEIQKEIYEIYKFMDDEGVEIGKDHKKGAKENQKEKRRSPTKENKKNPPQIQRKPQTAQKKQREKPTRPHSSNQNRNKALAIEKGEIMNQLQKQMKMIQDMKFSGPKIIINRTAAHKI